MRAQEKYLTTITEKTDTSTLETIECVRKAEAIAGTPPIHATVRVVNIPSVSPNR